MSSKNPTYLAFEHGCWDCGIPSIILGVYEDIIEATTRTYEAREKQTSNCTRYDAVVYLLPETKAHQ